MWKSTAHVQVKRQDVLVTPDTALQLVVAEDHRVHMCCPHMYTHMHTRYSETGQYAPKDVFASQPFRSQSRTIRHSKHSTEKGGRKRRKIEFTLSSSSL